MSIPSGSPGTLLTLHTEKATVGDLGLSVLGPSLLFLLECLLPGAAPGRSTNSGGEGQVRLGKSQELLHPAVGKDRRGQREARGRT